MVLAVLAAMSWSASWVSACDTCGCKGKAEAPKVAAPAAPAAVVPAVKCVACPLGQPADAAKPAAQCTGECKAGCCKGACKGDASKCVVAKAGAEAKTCPAQTAPAAEAKTCPAAKTCGAANKGCGYAVPVTDTKAVEPAKDAK